MHGEEDYKRFTVMMVWLSHRMKESGGLPKELKVTIKAGGVETVIDVIKDYYRALKDMPVQKIAWAVEEVYKRDTWFPMPNRIKELANIAPSSVMPQITNPVTLLPEVTPEQAARNLEKLNEIMESIGVEKFLV